jgi:4-amino-4-deoxy-L-arabinose transferase-like glycosyltransferase
MSDILNQIDEGSSREEDAKGGQRHKFFFRNRMRSGVNFFSISIPSFSWRLMLFFIFVVFAPFLGDRVIRPAGDDKVYVSQAIEMADQGHWFQQSLGNEPNYYKGPFHYLALRLGMNVFGSSMWATLWMNLFLVMLGSLALGSLVYRNMREFDGWPFWVGLAFALNAGIYSHVFASQMEVELAALMAIGIYYLDRAGPGKPDLKFWIVAGLIGWVKSPLHSVLLGSTALMFWAWNRELWPRVKSPLAWGAALTGVLVCCLGYAPAAIMDWKNFFETYVLRETLHKPANGAPWHYPIIPLFTYSLLPWMFPAFVAFADGISRLWRRQRPIRSTIGSKRVLALGVCLIFPSVAFFLYHPYRGQNYNLPAMGGVLLWVAAVWATRSERWSSFYSFALGLTSAVILIVPVLFTLLTRNFDPMPFWWPSWLLPLLWIGFLLTARGFWREGVTFHMARPASLARRSAWMFIALGALISTLGEREMIDIRDRVYGATKEQKVLTFSYYNLQKNIWSEWGYLNFQIPYPVRGVFNEQDLFVAIERGSVILVPGDQWLEDMRKRVEVRFPGAEWSIEPWRRWKTKGKNAEGKPVFRDAWESKDLTKIERNFYMVSVRPRSG